MEYAGFVATKGAAYNEQAEEKFKFVTFHSHKSSKKGKISNQVDTETPEITTDRKGIDIKRARREIIQFGINGFDTQKKQEAKIALAVSLGAKPPKNKYSNYKSILEQKKKQKASDQSVKNLQQAGKNALGVCTASKKFTDKSKIAKRKMNGSLLEAYGKAGKNIEKSKTNFKKSNTKRRGN